VKHLKAFNEDNNYPTKEVHLDNEDVIEINNILNIASDEGIKCEFDIATDVESKKSENYVNIIELYRNPHFRQLGHYHSFQKPIPKPNISSDEFIHILDNIVNRLNNLGNFKTMTRVYFDYKCEVGGWSAGGVNYTNTYNRSFSVVVPNPLLYKERIAELALSKLDVHKKYKEVEIDTVSPNSALILFTKG